MCFFMKRLNSLNNLILEGNSLEYLEDQKLFTMSPLETFSRVRSSVCKQFSLFLCRMTLLPFKFTSVLLSLDKTF